ncbi:MAG: CPBP family intramembrane glutamic endopeptidase [Verrucomicrobiales bacterium]
MSETSASESRNEDAARDLRPGLRWSVVVPALILPLTASFFYFVFFPGTPLGNGLYTGSKVFLLLWPLVAVGFILREPIANPYPVKRHLKSVAPGVLFALVIVGGLMLLIKATPLSVLIDENGPRIAERIEDLGVGDYFLLFALFISFAHAALEEFYWRWFVFGQLRRLLPGIGSAHFLAAVGFAAHHVVVLSQFFPLGWALGLGVCVGIGGAFWSIVYHRYGSLLGAWTSHMIIDLGLMWVGWEVLVAVG